MVVPGEDVSVEHEHPAGTVEHVAIHGGGVGVPAGAGAVAAHGEIGGKGAGHGHLVTHGLHVHVVVHGRGPGVVVHGRVLCAGVDGVGAGAQEEDHRKVFHAAAR